MFLLQTQDYKSLVTQSTYLYDFRNVTMGDMSQAAFLASKGLNFTRASDGFSAQTSESTLITGLTGNNRPRFGKSKAANTVGLILESSRINQLSKSRYPADTSVWVPGTNFTSPVHTSPDGQTLGGQISLTASQYSNYQSASGRVGSCWIRAQSGTSKYQVLMGGGVTATHGVVDTTWTRIVVMDGADHGNFIPLDTRSIGGNSVATDPQTLDADLFQYEYSAAGPGWASEYIDSSGTGSTTRAVEFCSVPSSTYSTYWPSGAQTGYMRFIAKGGRSVYPNPFYIWYVNSNNSAYVTPSTGYITTYINGNSYTTTTALTFSREDLVELQWVGGSGVNTTWKTKINGGSTTTLGTSGSSQGAYSGGSATGYICGDNTGTTLDCWLQILDFGTQYL